MEQEYWLISDEKPAAERKQELAYKRKYQRITECSDIALPPNLQARSHMRQLRRGMH
ncbi:hypothetical protein EMIT0215P_100100 [Pseudomonas serboccidentalis]